MEGGGGLLWRLWTNDDPSFLIYVRACVMRAGEVSEALRRKAEKKG